MATVTVKTFQIRRSYTAGYRPPTTGATSLKAGETLRNYADKLDLLGVGDGTWIETPLGDLIARKNALNQVIGDAGIMTLTAPGTGAVARSLSDRFGELVQLSDFGWDKTGATDAGPALRRAIAKLGASGGRIHICAGIVWINSAVPISRAIMIEGDGWQEGPNIAAGTWLKITDASFTPFLISGVEARGFFIRDVGIWQQQPVPTGSSWTPTDYPPVFDVSETLGMCNFQNLLCAGVTRVIRSYNSGRLKVDGIYGQVYKYCVSVDKSTDLPRIENIHCWVYVTSDSRVLAYQAVNSVGVLSLRNDNPFICNIFVIGMRAALHFATSADGVTSKFGAVNIEADIAGYGILIEANGVTGQVTNLRHQGNHPNGGSLSGSTAMLCNGNDIIVTISNIDARFADYGGITIFGVRNSIKVSGGFIGSWDQSATGRQAFDIADGGSAANANVIQASDIEFAGSLNVVAAGTAGRIVKMLDFYSRSNAPNYSPRLASSGLSSTVYIDVSGGNVLRLDNPGGSGNSNLLLRSNNGGLQIAVESSAANSDLGISAKGTGVVLQQSRQRLLNLPNSASGLTTGDVYRDTNGFLKAV